MNEGRAAACLMMSVALPLSLPLAYLLYRHVRQHGNQIPKAWCWYAAGASLLASLTGAGLLEIAKQWPHWGWVWGSHAAFILFATILLTFKIADAALKITAAEEERRDCGGA